MRNNEQLTEEEIADIQEDRILEEARDIEEARLEELNRSDN